MKTKLIKTTAYSGFLIESNSIPKAEQPEVEILGVMIPCDPGMVHISNSGRTGDVPAFL